MPIQEKETQLATDLRTFVTRMVKKLRGKTSAAADLSLTERSILRSLDENKEMLPSELAAAEKITSQSISGILHHLTDLGYIIRKESKTDKRKVLVSISKAGQNLLYKRAHERDEWLSQAIQQTLTTREQEMLLKMIEPLSRLVDFK